MDEDEDVRIRAKAAGGAGSASVSSVSESRIQTGDTQVKSNYLRREDDAARGQRTEASREHGRWMVSGKCSPKDFAPSDIAMSEGRMKLEKYGNLHACIHEYNCARNITI